jgi:hypothetical protein
MNETEHLKSIKLIISENNSIKQDLFGVSKYDFGPILNQLQLDYENAKSKWNLGDAVNFDDLISDPSKITWVPNDILISVLNYWYFPRYYASSLDLFNKLNALGLIDEFILQKHPIVIDIGTNNCSKSLGFSHSMSRFDKPYENLFSKKWIFDINKFNYNFVTSKSRCSQLIELAHLPSWNCSDDTGGWWINDDLNVFHFDFDSILNSIRDYIKIGYLKSNDYMQLAVKIGDSYVAKQDLLEHTQELIPNISTSLFSIIIFLPTRNEFNEWAITLINKILDEFKSIPLLVVNLNLNEKYGFQIDRNTLHSFETIYSGNFLIPHFQNEKYSVSVLYKQ